MLRNKTFTAIIPARGGSRGIPNKNTKEIAGKPLIYWCIKAAKDSGIFKSIIVSSDSDEIIKLAIHYGVLASRRPSHLATDTSPVRDTISYTLENIAKPLRTDYVQLIQPTSPLIRPSTIRRAAVHLVDRKMDMTISVCEASVPLGVIKPLPGNWNLKNWFPKEMRNTNRQSVDTVYCLNGVIYLGKWNIFESGSDWWEYNIWPFVMFKDDSVDIDDKYDWQIAELKLKQRLESKKSPILFRNEVNARNFHPEKDLGMHTNE